MAAGVRAQLTPSLSTDVEAFTSFRPDERHEGGAGAMLDQVGQWRRALRTLRPDADAIAAASAAPERGKPADGSA